MGKVIKLEMSHSSNFRAFRYLRTPLHTNLILPPDATIIYLAVGTVQPPPLRVVIPFL
jgi:hypothetical protein